MDRSTIGNAKESTVVHCSMASSIPIPNAERHICNCIVEYRTVHEMKDPVILNTKL